MLLMIIKHTFRALLSHQNRQIPDNSIYRFNRKIHLCFSLPFWPLSIAATALWHDPSPEQQHRVIHQYACFSISSPHIRSVFPSGPRLIKAGIDFIFIRINQLAHEHSQEKCLAVLVIAKRRVNLEGSTGLFIASRILCPLPQP